MDKLLETKEATISRFSCGCGTPAHALDITVGKNTDRELILYLYSTPTLFRDRLKWCWKMIRTGEGYKSDFVFREEDVPELLNIVAQSCNISGRFTSGT